MKDKFGTNYRPTLVIHSWADRPEDVPDEVPNPGSVWRGNGAQASQQTQPPEHVPPPPQHDAPPPPQQAAPQAAAATDAPEF